LARYAIRSRFWMLVVALGALAQPLRAQVPADSVAVKTYTGYFNDTAVYFTAFETNDAQFAAVNNLVYAASGSSVRTVLIDGRVVLDEGRLTTLDERALYERVERLSREHIRRAGVPIESKWPVVP